MNGHLRKTAVVLALLTMTSFGARAEASKCTGAKLKAAGKKSSCKLGVYAKAASKNVPVDSTKLDDCEAKFNAAFAKAESKGDCVAPAGDADAIEGKVDAFVDDVNTELTTPPTTSTTTTPSTSSTTTTTSTPTCTFVCPPIDLAARPLISTSATTELFCRYQAVPNDYYCKYFLDTGLLKQDHDAGFCAPVAVPSCS